MWNDTINVYHGDGLLNLSSWTTSHKRLPYDLLVCFTQLFQMNIIHSQIKPMYVDAELEKPLTSITVTDTWKTEMMNLIMNRSAR